MEFRFAKKKDKEAVEFLWSYCFEPKGDPFFTYYFEHCYRPEDTLLGVVGKGKNEKIVADVHLRPYRICLRDKVMPMAYIVGVATHPEARRSGVGGQLLEASLKALRERGHAMTILMPSMAGFYMPYGWSLYCHQWERRMSLEDLRPLTDRTLEFQFLTSIEDWPLLATVYENYTEGLSGYALRDEKHWQTLLGSLLAEGVYIVLVYEGERPAGYMFYRLGAPEIFVSEMIYTSRKAQKALFGYLYNHRSQGESLRWNEGLHDKGYVFYPNGKSGNGIMPYMMSRVVDVERAFKEVPFSREALAQSGKKDIRLTFSVEDPLVEWNRGIFHVTYSAEGVKVEVGSSDKEPSINIGVGPLSVLFMGRLTADELAFEGMLQADDEKISLLKALYPKKNTFINEWY